MREERIMSTRPLYLEVVLTVLAITFLSLIVVGAIDPRGESFAHVTMRTGH